MENNPPLKLPSASPTTSNNSKISSYSLSRTGRRCRFIILSPLCRRQALSSNPPTHHRTNFNGTQSSSHPPAQKRSRSHPASHLRVYDGQKSQTFPSMKTPTSSRPPQPMAAVVTPASKPLAEFLALSYWKEKKAAVIVRAPIPHRRPRCDRGRYGIVLPNFVHPRSTANHQRLRQCHNPLAFLRRAATNRRSADLA